MFVTDIYDLEGNLRFEQGIIEEDFLFELLDELLEGFGDEEWMGVVGCYVQSGQADQTLLVVESTTYDGDGCSVLHSHFCDSQPLGFLLNRSYMESFVLRSKLFDVEVYQILIVRFFVDSCLLQMDLYDLSKNFQSIFQVYFISDLI